MVTCKFFLALLDGLPTNREESCVCSFSMYIILGVCFSRVRICYEGPGSGMEIEGLRWARITVCGINVGRE